MSNVVDLIKNTYQNCDCEFNSKYNTLRINNYKYTDDSNSVLDMGLLKDFLVKRIWLRECHFKSIKHVNRKTVVRLSDCVVEQQIISYRGITYWTGMHENLVNYMKSNNDYIINVYMMGISL